MLQRLCCKRKLSCALRLCIIVDKHGKRNTILYSNNPHQSCYDPIHRNTFLSLCISTLYGFQVIFTRNLRLRLGKAFVPMPRQGRATCFRVCAESLLGFDRTPVWLTPQDFPAIFWCRRSRSLPVRCGRKHSVTADLQRSPHVRQMPH